MSPVELIFFAGFASAGVRVWLRRGWRGQVIAVATGSTIVPAAILYHEFFVPYQGGGASMWPIAVAFGGVYGLCAALVGVLLVDLARGILR